MKKYQTEKFNLQEHRLSQNLKKRQHKTLKPGRHTVKLSHGVEGFKDAIDSYMEALSRQSSSRYKLPTTSKIPKSKAGGNWRRFVSDFKDIMRLPDLKPSHQLAHLNQAVPEEANSPHVIRYCRVSWIYNHFVGYLTIQSEYSKKEYTLHLDYFPQG